METQEDKSKIEIKKLEDHNILSSSPKNKTSTANVPDYVFMKLADKTDVAAEHDKDKND